jgi:mannose-6-phosphate isomerase-like protein (cupin superfamily)
MANYTVKKIDEMEAIYGGAFKRARAELGVSSWGMQVIDFPPNMGDQYPEHAHEDDGQEEVYLPLSGSAEVEVEGERVKLDPGTMVRIGPGVKRRIRTGSEPCRMLALGGAPGKVYEPPDMSRLGVPDPLLQQQT